MKRIGKQEKELIKVFITVAASAAACIFCWIFLNSQLALLCQGYMNNIAKSNEYIVQVMAQNIETSANSSRQAAQIIKAAPSSGSRYWFLLSSDSLIFERNEETTAALGPMSYTDLEDYFIRSGGKGINQLFELLDGGKDFSAVVSKSSTSGSELISVKFIKIGDEKFCVGTSISQNYMLSQGKVNERIFYIRIMAVLLFAGATAVIAYFSFMNRRKALIIASLQLDLTDKNILVQEQGERLADTDTDSTDNSDDTLTGLYNKRFFDTVVAKLSERKTQNIGIMYIRITNFLALNYANGFAFTNQLLTDTASLIKENTSDTDICARIGKNEFAVLTFNNTHEETIKAADKLNKDLAKIYPSATFLAVTSYADEKIPIENALKDAMEGTGRTS